MIIEKKIDEYRIVGSIGNLLVFPAYVLVMVFRGLLILNYCHNRSEPLDNLEVDTPFRIQGITAAGYDGQYVVFDKSGDTEVKFKVKYRSFKSTTICMQDQLFH